MSIGYPDFNTRALVEQYNVVNVVSESFDMNVIQRFYIFYKSGVKGLLERLIIDLESSIISDHYKIVLSIDLLDVDEIHIQYDKDIQYVKSKKGFIKITKQDYKTLVCYVELIKPIMFFSSFGLFITYYNPTPETHGNIIINYMTASPTMIYQPV